MIIVYDLESTCWNDYRSSQNVSEIIEIGAVKVNLSAEDPFVDTFNMLVRPIKHKQLSSFCKKLTGISQEDIDKARDFPYVYKKFHEWIGSKDNIMASWGEDWLTLERNCLNHNLKQKHPLHSNLNIATLFKEKYNQKRLSLSNAIKFLELEFEGTPHRGISDAINTAIILLYTMGVK